MKCLLKSSLVLLVLLMFSGVVQAAEPADVNAAQTACVARWNGLGTNISLALIRSGVLADAMSDAWDEYYENHDPDEEIHVVLLDAAAALTNAGAKIASASACWTSAQAQIANSAALIAVPNYPGAYSSIAIANGIITDGFNHLEDDGTPPSGAIPEMDECQEFLQEAIELMEED